VIVFFGGFYVMQLFQSVMIITLSHTSEVMDAQDAEGRRDARRRSRKRGAAEEEKEDEAKMTESGAKGVDVVDVDGVGMLINAVGAYAGAAFRAARRSVRRDASGTGRSVSATASVRAMEKEKRLRATAWGRFRLRAKRVANHQRFQRFVLSVIVANTVTMAMDSYGQSEAYYAALNTCETVFTSVFIAEFVLKHVAVGPWKYWSNPWNVVDGAVVVSGVVELAVGTGADGIATLRMLRVLRIFAGLKGLRRHRAFRQVFAAVINGVRRILSFCLVFSLFLTVFAILGMQLFGGVYGDAAPASRATFDTFGDAMLALFIVCTGENTFSIGWDLSRASGTKWAVVYVAAWSLVSTSLLALVLGVLIQATVEPVVLEEAQSDSDDEFDEGPDTQTAPESERETREEKTLDRNVSMSLFASPRRAGSRDGTPRARDAQEASAKSPFADASVSSARHSSSSVPSVDVSSDAAERERFEQDPKKHGGGGGGRAPVAGRARVRRGAARRAPRGRRGRRGAAVGDAGGRDRGRRARPLLRAGAPGGAPASDGRASERRARERARRVGRERRRRRRTPPLDRERRPTASDGVGFGRAGGAPERRRAFGDQVRHGHDLYGENAGGDAEAQSRGARG
jgi:hypothetical protein